MMSCSLKDLQNAEFEILCKLDDLCKKYKIDYTLFAGTLLGAIRHKGFIPWDDDVDVIMDIKNYKKLHKIIKKYPIEGYELCSYKTEKEYPLYFAKLRKKIHSCLKRNIMI